MAISKAARNKIFRLVQDAKALLVKEVTEQLQQFYGISPDGSVLMVESLTTDQSDILYTARLLRQRLAYVQANLPAEEDRETKAVAQLVREQAFTVLNRFASLRMAEERGIIRETIRKEYNSEGFQVFDTITGGGKTADQYTRYKWYLYAVFDELALDLPSLFDRFSPYALIFPSESAVRRLLALINNENITWHREEGAPVQNLWQEDETIGWIYQYYNSREEISEMREGSGAPRNSRELAVRNQFFTPRYVVQFLTDNSLGRIWYEMTACKTSLVQLCEYMVRRPNEVFLEKGAVKPEAAEDDIDHIDYREAKDPREILILDPACGSMHFGLYSFDLLEVMYREAWDNYPHLLADLRQTMNRQQFLLQVPELIIRHNIHGVDIDPRALQIAALSLWLRAQKSFEKLGLKAEDRPAITRSNLVLAEAMPGNAALLSELVKPLDKPMRQLVLTIWEKMQLAGETGLLLKIEDEIDATIKEIAVGLTEEAKRAQLKLGSGEAQTLAAEQAALYSTKRYRETFLLNAEENVLKVLKQLAETATNGDAYQKLLFADDTARGFSFIELCRKKYDIVLMNPPFGDSTINTKEYLTDTYPTSKNELAACFVERMVDLLNHRAFCCAISTRNIFFLGSYIEWREKYLINNNHLKYFADFGMGVLDALVETSAYIFSKQNTNGSLFIRLVHYINKQEYLVAALLNLNSSQDVYYHNPSKFALVSNKPLCYWINDKSIKLFNFEERFEKDARRAIVGLQTSDDERFLRLAWEIRDRTGWPIYLMEEKSRRFFADSKMVVNWKSSGKELKNFFNKKGKLISVVRNEGEYFVPGVSWARRTSIFQPHIIERGCISTPNRYLAKGVKEDELLFICGLWNSNYYDYLIKLSMERQSSPTFKNGTVNLLPYPKLRNELREVIATEVRTNHLMYQRIFSFDETSLYFELPFETLCNSIEESAKKTEDRFTTYRIRYLNSLNKINDIIFSVFTIDSCERQKIISLLQSEGGRSNDESSFSYYRKPYVENIFSWLTGCAFGRWDVRMSKYPGLVPIKEDIFSPLPTCSPGSLISSDFLPASRINIVSDEWLAVRKTIENKTVNVEKLTINAKDYPVQVLWEGIGVVEAGHQSDILTHIRKVLNYIWNEKSGEIENELVDLLGVQELEEWLNHPNKFFNSHLNQYTQNKRIAPIYWPLSTKSGSYTVWIYYPNLTDQTLYTVVNNFIQPKRKDIGEEIKKLELKQGDRKVLLELQGFADELQEMEDEILRIAALPYKPNHEDGVLITAAPLYKLFRHAKWRKATEDYWKALEKGEYDWAHLVFNIAAWQERVKKKCRTDLSMAIAHGLEEVCEVKPKKKKEKKIKSLTKKASKELDFE